MRLSLLTFALLLTPIAHAQYANRSLGIGVQASSSIAHSPLLALTLDFSLYIENGFDLFIRFPFSMTHVPVGADTPSGAGDIFATGGSIGVRYFFLEETLRPWVGIQLSGLVLVTKPDVTWFVGPGASAGVDYFFTDSIAAGLRGSYDFFAMLNETPRHNLSAGLSVSVLF